MSQWNGLPLSLEFRAWKKMVVSQKAEIEAIPMFFCFILSGEIINSYVPLRHYKLVNSS